MSSCVVGLRAPVPVVLVQSLLGNPARLTFGGQLQDHLLWCQMPQPSLDLTASAHYSVLRLPALGHGASRWHSWAPHQLPQRWRGWSSPYGQRSPLLQPRMPYLVLVHQDSGLPTAARRSRPAVLGSGFGPDALHLMCWVWSCSAEPSLESPMAIHPSRLQGPACSVAATAMQDLMLAHSHWLVLR